MTKPVLQALVLADQLYQDKDTGKMVIAGTFTKYIVSQQKRETDGTEVEKEDEKREQLPQIGNMPIIGKSGSPFAYVCLTEIREEANLELRYVDLSDNTVLIKVDLNVRCKDPLQAVELKIPLPQLPCRHFGAYALELLCEDELLGSWRVTVTSAEDLPEREKT